MSVTLTSTTKRIFNFDFYEEKIGKLYMTRGLLHFFAQWQVVANGNKCFLFFSVRFFRANPILQ